MSIHPTAIVHRDADIASGVEIGPFCVVDAHVRVASGCRIYQNVYLTGWTEIGEGCVLHPGVIVGHEPQDVKYKGERTYCRVGAGSVLREYVTVHRGTIPESSTVIGDHCTLLNGSHVGHNGRLGVGVTLISQVLLGGHVEVGDRAVLGGAAGIHQFVRIGKLAMVAGVARVTLDVLPFALADSEGRVSGINRVGLRRAGLPRDDISEIRECYRILHSSRLSFGEAVAKIQSIVRTPSGKDILEFVRSPSRRGIAGRSKARGLVRSSNESDQDADLKG